MTPRATLLYIDDDLRSLRGYRQPFQPLDDVLTASNAGEALAVLGRERPSCASAARPGL